MANAIGVICLLALAGVALSGRKGSRIDMDTVLGCAAIALVTVGIVAIALAV